MEEQIKQERIRKVDEIIAGIKLQMERPNYAPQTSSEMRLRADRLRSMATGIKLNGGIVKPEYE